MLRLTHRGVRKGKAQALPWDFKTTVYNNIPNAFLTININPHFFVINDEFQININSN